VLVQLGGLEPPTSCSTDRRSNQLSYNCILTPPSIWRGLRRRETRGKPATWQAAHGSKPAVGGAICNPHYP
jgi:hypothetical protein